MKPRDSLTAIGGGSSMTGVLFLMAGRGGAHPGLLLIGEILAAVGFILLIVKKWKEWQS
jgi:hypothetical protein